MRPNFVFILADDLGYADLGCYGGRTPCSPDLDRMAADGLRFTNGYSNSPVCSPTRFALMTGRYQYRLRGGNDEPIASRHRGKRAGPAAGTPDAGIAAARRGLRDGARRQVAHRIPAALRPTEERLRRVLRPDERRRSIISHTATRPGNTISSRERRKPTRKAISPISSPSAPWTSWPAARKPGALPAVGPLQGAALALGNARRRSRGPRSWTIPTPTAAPSRHT